MNQQETRELLSQEAAAELGAHAPGACVVLSLTKKYAVPTSVHASNVRSMMKPGDLSALCCQGVVSREPLVGGEEMCLVESLALLLGFYNNGFDEAGFPILVAAYGKLQPVCSWRVTIGPTVGATVMRGACHYSDVVLYIVSQQEHKPLVAPETT
jgi:hypothetical protein